MSCPIKYPAAIWKFSYGWNDGKIPALALKYISAVEAVLPLSPDIAAFQIHSHAARKR